MRARLQLVAAWQARSSFVPAAEERPAARPLCPTALPLTAFPAPNCLPCSGVAEMAAELFEVLRPHMEGVPRLHLAGHSLGGSLATLVGLTAHLKLGGSCLGGGGGGAASGRGSSTSSSGTSSDAEPVEHPPRQQHQQQQRQQRQRLQVEVTTFGSPPVLALAHGAEEDGRSILQARGCGAWGA